MNIFVVDDDPAIAAQSLCDKHVVKMCLETAQMLSSVARSLGADDAFLYRSTHANHPCTLWAGETADNFLWLAAHGLALCDEYTYRYGRSHKSQAVIQQALQHLSLLPVGTRTPFAQAMPDEYRQDCAVSAYRAYYHGDKAYMAAWKYRSAPAWWCAQGGE